MLTDQVYYVLQNPPTIPEPEKRSGKRTFVALAIIGVGAYMLYQSEKKVQKLEAELRTKNQYSATFPN